MFTDRAAGIGEILTHRRGIPPSDNVGTEHQWVTKSLQRGAGREHADGGSDLGRVSSARFSTRSQSSQRSDVAAESASAEIGQEPGPVTPVAVVGVAEGATEAAGPVDAVGAAGAGESESEPHPASTTEHRANTTLHLIRHCRRFL